MRELQLILSDDLTYAETGERVPADETVVIALDNKTRELDLTAENAKKIRELLGPWIDAGHSPGNQPATKPTASDPSSHKGGVYVLSRARQRVIRDFADNLGLKSSDGQRPIYRTPGGGYYYPYKLRKMFEAHQAAEAARNGGSDVPR